VRGVIEFVIFIILGNILLVSSAFFIGLLRRFFLRFFFRAASVKQLSTINDYAVFGNPAEIHLSIPILTI
jgi:hypothetical protein